MTKLEFVDKFWENFIESIALDERKKYQIEKSDRRFLWNAFASVVLPSLEGELANVEFDKVDKTGAFEIQYNYFGISDENTRPLSQSHYNSQNVNHIPEFYIIGKDFAWCYIVTHELDLCGPYFCYNRCTNKIKILNS